MSEQAERSRGWFYLAVVLALLPLLYVASIGPANLLVDRLDLDLDSFQAAYAPVDWLAAHTPLRRPLEWYVDLWAPAESPPAPAPAPLPPR
jgi:hypothetical protein